MSLSLEEIYNKAQKAINDAKNIEQLDGISISYLGRKGAISQYLRNISKLPVEQRPEAGKKANGVKSFLTKQLEKKSNDFSNAFSDDFSKIDSIDVSLPGRSDLYGSLHPITQVNKEISSIFAKIGFNISEGPEVETDYFNFEALNIPKNHPARDMQDTFYISQNTVLRTHTSPIQIRVMKKQAPPVKIIAPGKVYRKDSDVTHTPMFHQIEGLLVDKHVTFGDLKGTLTTFIHQFFDKQTNLRFRPSFFPFTEPSAEVDIRCVICKGKGCRVCSYTGWLEVLGSGMVHPKVFESVNYDTDKYTGFAFGMGIERLAMLKYQINDIRIFFENDNRFLRQF